MRVIVLVAILLAPFLSCGQAERIELKRMSLEFENHFNAGEYEKVFELFSADMKSYLTKQKTIDFLKGIKANSGNIKSRKFIRYEKGTFASYKTVFERSVFAVNISVDGNENINGLSIRPFKDNNRPELARNLTKMILPFDGEWTVHWGGDTKEQNHHNENLAQKYAFDIVVTDEQGKSFRTNGKTNEDYFAFGQKLIAPCDAEVVLVVDGIKDNRPGILNPIYIPGNTVVLKTKNNEFLYFAHFKQHSIVVKQGQNVKMSDVLGLCGNSGNSSEAHLHFHVQDEESMNSAIGAKCYFDNIYVNGEVKKEYSPIKSDRIKNK